MRPIHENQQHLNSLGVQPAPLSQKTRIRCPYCFQIFQTFRQEFLDDQPEFQCSVCHEKFWIEAKEPSTVITGQPLETLKSPPSASGLSFSKKVCPRCTEEVPAGDPECRFCGVQFIKMIEGVESTFQLRGTWAKVIKSWHDESKHDEFLRACHRQKELIYGISCYGRILKEDKDNKKAKEMIKRMEALTWFFKEEVSPLRASFGKSTLSQIPIWFKSHAFDALMLALVLCLFLYAFL